jgi:DNA mismatch repair protein MutS2
MELLMEKQKKNKSEEALRLLEYHRILDEISAYAKSPASKELILSIRPLIEIKDIERRFNEIIDMRRLISEIELPVYEYSDISGLLQKLRPDGSFLEPLELHVLMRVLENIQRLKNLLDKRKDLPFLKNIIDRADEFGDIIEKISLSVSEEGEILDSASLELKDIRIRKRNIENKIRKRLDEIIRSKALASFLQDEYVTLRSGRWVIPLKADFKGKIPGIIHDVSRTGETIYVEPLEIIGLANEHENILAEEKTEEIRILKELSSILRSRLPSIEESYNILLHIDLLHSIARFSERFRLEFPDITEDNEIVLKEARHPVLLILKDKGLIDEVVPLDLELRGDRRVMVITGPNAGGKTIALKTAGLLTCLALSGIPIPASSNSKIPLFKNILVDIGDEQSIEESLSSFSGHVKNIADIFERAQSSTLILLDELGRATDPKEGTAIGCAILEELFKKGATVIATTHLIEIALYVHTKEGMVSASMDFDHKEMKPLYKLKTGEIGLSHGLKIAERYGMPRDILERAREYHEPQRLELDGLLQELRDKRESLDRELKRLSSIEEYLKEKEEDLKSKEEEIEKKKEHILRKAYEEAKGLIDETKRLINQLLEDAKKRPKEALKALRKKEDEIDLHIKKSSEEASTFEPEIGQVVYVKSLGYDGTVTRIEKESRKVRIRAGAFEIEVPLSEIGPPGGISIIPERGRIETPEALEDFIDLTGLRVEEALSRLETYLNHALLSQKHEIKIIHGIGTGRLKKAVREYLKGHPFVDNLRPGLLEEGGEGVTIVRMK